MYKMYALYDRHMDEQVPVTEARARLSELINRVGYGKDRIVLTRHGKPLVALIPAETFADSGEGDAAPVVLDLSARSAGPDQSSLTLAARDSSSTTLEIGPSG